MDDPERIRSWGHWSSYATACRRDPYLRFESKAIKQNLLLAFATRVRTGLYGNQKQVGYQLVEKAIRHVGQTLQLAGYSDP